jgi:hypothetical protein
MMSLTPCSREAVGLIQTGKLEEFMRRWYVKWIYHHLIFDQFLA